MITSTVRKPKTPKKPVKRVDLDALMGPCVASALISRLSIFWPSKRNVPLSRWEASTQWGKVSVQGRLSQVHRSVLDAIFAFPIAHKRLPNELGEPDKGPAIFVVNPYEIATRAGVDHKRKWLEGILNDLKQADVRIEQRNHCAGIISEWEDTEENYPLRGGAVPGEAPLIRITVSSAWMKIMDETMSVRYSKLVPLIGSLESGATQALVRFLITHDNARYSLREALAIVGALREEISKSQRNRVVAAVIAERQRLSSDFGINLSESTTSECGWAVTYRKHPQVFFASPDVIEQTPEEQ